MMIRSATLADLDAIIALYVRGWQQSYVGLVDGDYLATMANNQRSRDYLAGLFDSSRDDTTVLVAESDNGIVGFIAAGLNRDIIDKNLAEIYAVYVDSAHQHQQFGQKLFNACYKALQQYGFTKILVWTFAANSKARKAYQRWGGTLATTTRNVSVAGQELAEVSFDWHLTNQT